MFTTYITIIILEADDSQRLQGYPQNKSQETFEPPIVPMSGK